MKIVSVFGLLLATNVVTGGVILHSSANVDKNVGWTVHTYQVPEQTDRMMASMVDQETGLRGFLITGKDANLDPLRSGEKAFRDSWSEMKSLTSDNPTQQKRLDEIRREVDDWQRDVSHAAIGLMAKPGTEDAARDIERTGRGKKYFDQIRALLGEVKQAEASLLGARSDAMNAAQSTIFWSVVLSVLAVLALAVAAAFAMNKLIAVPIRVTIGLMDRMRGGDYAVAITGTERKDEIGLMNNALSAFRDGLAAAEKARLEQTEREATERRRLARREKLAADFVGRMQTLAAGFARSSGEVADSAKNLSATAEETSRQTQAVAAAAEQAASNVQTVAASSEEMATSVREITG